MSRLARNVRLVRLPSMSMPGHRLSGGIWDALQEADESSVRITASPRGDDASDSSASADATPKISAVAVRDRRAAVVADGQLYTWGEALSGALGHGAKRDVIKAPTRVDALKGVDVRGVDLGHAHTAVWCREGRVYTAGENREGQLGRPGLPSFVRVQVGKPVRQVACSKFFTAAVTADGRVVTWGGGYNGELGNNESLLMAPGNVPGVENVKRIVVGTGFAACLTGGGAGGGGGEVVWWGRLVGEQKTPTFLPTLITCRGLAASNSSLFVTDGRAVHYLTANPYPFNPAFNWQQLKGIPGDAPAIRHLVAGKGYVLVTLRDGSMYMAHLAAETDGAAQPAPGMKAHPDPIFCPISTIDGLVGTAVDNGAALCMYE